MQHLLQRPVVVICNGKIPAWIGSLHTGIIFPQSSKARIVIGVDLLYAAAICLFQLIDIDELLSVFTGQFYVHTDFDTKEKALSGAKAAEKGLK